MSSNKAQSTRPIEERVAEGRSSRPVYVFDLPEGVGSQIKTVGLVELTPSDEIMAAKMSTGDTTRLAFELAKLSLYEVDGQRVSIGDGSADAAWLRLGPRARSLVVQAFAALNVPSSEDSAAFLRSRQVRVG